MRYVLLLFVFSVTGIYGQDKVTPPTEKSPTSTNKNMPRVTLTGTQVRDIEFAEVDGEHLKLDLYLPKQPAGSSLVVWIHGGGWQGGSRTGVFISWLSNHGYTVASISYRFTDVATWPAQIHDCKGAIRWLRAQADKYGYRTDKIAVAGASAGGHLAALVGTTAGNRKLEGRIGGNPDQSSAVDAVVDFYGPTDFILRSKNQPTRANEVGSVVYKLLGGGADQKTVLARQASPSYHVTRDDVPMLVFHGDQDRTVFFDQSLAIQKAYRKAGLPLTLHTVTGAGHGGIGFYTGANAQRMYDFLQKHIRPQ